jgi:hypothetical protein
MVAGYEKLVVDFWPEKMVLQILKGSSLLDVAGMS